MYLSHNTISGASEHRGNTAPLVINRSRLQSHLGAGKHSESITHELKKKHQDNCNLDKTHSGAKPTSYPFLSLAAVYPNNFHLQSTRKWLEQNKVSFSTLVQYHFSLHETVFRFEAISSFGFITSVINFKEIHSNHDISEMKSILLVLECTY